MIVGNPPFHGDRHLRGLLGDDYVEWLKSEFNAGIKDHCVYWFRKAHDHLEAGPARRVGRDKLDRTEPGSRGEPRLLVERGGGTTEAVVHPGRARQA